MPPTTSAQFKLWEVPRSKPNTNQPQVVREGDHETIYTAFIQVSGQNRNPAVRYVMTDEHNTPLFAG